MFRRKKEEFFDFERSKEFVYLKNETKDKLLGNRKIEILWPDGDKTIHNIIIETIFYPSSQTTFHEPFISLNYYGSQNISVKLTSIDGIKIKLIK